LKSEFAEEISGMFLVDFLITKGRVEQREVCFKKVIELAKKFESPYIEMVAVYHWGELYRKKGNENLSIRYFERALKIAEGYGYEHFLKRLVVEGSDDLKFCVQNNIARDFIINTLKETKTDNAKKLLAEIKQIYSLPDLRINLFGKIEIFDGQGNLHSIKWKTKKSRALFIYFLINPKQIFSRDQLLDIFWPNSKLNKGVLNLHTNLTFIKKALAGVIKSAKSPILYSHFGYQWNSEIYVETDIQHFENLLARARVSGSINKEECLKLLEEALSIYRGDFCPDIYESWSEERRLYFKEEANKIAKKLGEYYYQKGDYHKAIEFYKRGTEIDPLDEESHIGLMRCFGTLGNKNAVISQYKRLKGNLRRNLSIQPSSQAEKVYQEIITQI
jgi:two-component SAPR family response regulator